MATPLSPVVDRGRALLQDLRLLGAGAPLRVGLELSKKVGGHAAIFGRLARQGADPTARGHLVWTHPLPVLSPAELAAVDPAVRLRTLTEAGHIADGTIELFGQRLDLGADPDWHAAIDDPGRWPLEPWWEIDIRSAARLGDVKWVWELGRHRHLVILARAVALEPENERWLEVLRHQLDSWLTANPPETGIHWYSNLEVALRAIAWCEILGLAGDALPPATRAEMVAALHHSGRHLLADLPYTVSTMRNNHLLGDALGLLVLGAAFADDARAARWRSVGDRMFSQQLGRQVHPDGSQIEDAVSYHRFVLEMLLTRLRLGASGPDVRRAVRTSAEHLARLGVFEGPVPRYGDGDEGRVLTSTGPFDDLTGSTVAALLVAGGEAHIPAAVDPAAFDEVSWYPMPTPRPVEDPIASPPAPTTSAASVAAAVSTVGADAAPGPGTAAASPAVWDDPRGRVAVRVGGGISRARVGPFAVWLKAGGDTSHGHADLCSTVIAWTPPPADDAPPVAPHGKGLDLEHLDLKGLATSPVWLVGDPGTGTYNGPAVERDYFRATIAHSALRLGDEDQLVPYRAFRWRHAPTGAAGAPILLPGVEPDGEGDTVVLWGWHGAYVRFDPPRRVVRAVVLEPADATDDTAGVASAPGRVGEGGRVTVIDWVEGPPGIDWALSLPLGPSVGYADGTLRAAGSPATVGLSFPVPLTERCGQERPFDGWWSAAYGSRAPALRLEGRGQVVGPVVWQLRAPSRHEPPHTTASPGAPAPAPAATPDSPATSATPATAVAPDSPATSATAVSPSPVVDGATVTIRPRLWLRASFEDGSVALTTPTTTSSLDTRASDGSPA